MSCTAVCIMCHKSTLIYCPPPLAINLFCITQKQPQSGQLLLQALGSTGWAATTPCLFFTLVVLSPYCWYIYIYECTPSTRPESEPVSGRRPLRPVLFVLVLWLRPLHWATRLSLPGLMKGRGGLIKTAIGNNLIKEHEGEAMCEGYSDSACVSSLRLARGYIFIFYPFS